jgi:hypothetical protein
MTPRQWMLAAVGRLQERGDTDLARQLADAERCATELLEAAKAEQARADKWGVSVSPAFTRAIANMERVKG